MKPVLFFAFANDKDNYLDNLKEEEREIRNALAQAHDSGLIEFLSIGSTTAADIFNEFNRHRDRIAIFHYGGHAGGTQLSLEDEPGNANGLAKLFAEAPKLQLVFLNGCSTKGQVDKLFKAGVKSVIATTNPIDDTKAREFATEFYKTLATKGTLETAFNSAFAFLQTHGKIKDKDVKPTLEGIPEADGVWGMYTKYRSALGWKLTEPTLVFPDKQIPSKAVNEYLLTVTLDALKEFVPYKAVANPAQDRLNRKGHLINNYPSIIGSQISNLFQKHLEKKDILRIRQMQVSFIRIIRFIVSIVISNLWEEIHKKETTSISNEARFQIDSFINASQEDWKGFSYLSLLKILFAEFHTQNLDWILENFSQLFTEESEFKKTISFFESLHAKLEIGITDAEIEKITGESEYYFSLLLKELSFLSECYLTSNKNIFIMKSKFHREMFNHEMQVLVGNQSEEENRQVDYFLDSHSVFLVCTTKSGICYLNLSPFILDINSFQKEKTNISDIYLFLYSDAKKNTETIYYDHLSEGNIKMEEKPLAISAEMISQLEEEKVWKELFQSQLELFGLLKTTINRG